MAAKRHIKKLSFPLLILKDKLQGGNENFDTSAVKTLVMFVGPYRNLSTYMAANLALHPNCDVLNHAGIRVLNNWKLNFLKEYTTDKYHNFLRFFNYAQKTGYKGVRGGNIIYSHAFESNPDLMERYKKLPPNAVKSCFVWKESHLVTNIFMENPENLNKMISENSAIKFVFPIRNPLDCATSNMNTGKYKWFGDISKNEKEIVKAIFKQYAFFLELNKTHDGRVHFIFENEINVQTLDKLVRFIETEKQIQWEEETLDNYQVKKGYKYPQELVDWCLDLINNSFESHPEFQQKLIDLVKTTNQN
jgi:hypothetical protein